MCWDPSEWSAEGIWGGEPEREKPAPPTELEERQEEVGLLQLDRLEQALLGELPLPESWEQEKEIARTNLSEQLSREGKTAGSSGWNSAMAEFERNWGIREDAVMRGELEGGAAMMQGQQQFMYQQKQGNRAYELGLMGLQQQQQSQWQNLLLGAGQVGGQLLGSYMGGRDRSPYGNVTTYSGLYDPYFGQGGGGDPAYYEGAGGKGPGYPGISYGDPYGSYGYGYEGQGYGYYDEGGGWD